MENVYTKYDLSELLKISIGTIDNKMKLGLLNYMKIGKSVRFTEEDVDSFIKECYKEKHLSRSISGDKVSKLRRILSNG